MSLMRTVASPATNTARPRPQPRSSKLPDKPDKPPEVADKVGVEGVEVADNQLKVVDNKGVEASKVADNSPEVADRPWGNGCRMSSKARALDMADQAGPRGRPDNPDRLQ